MFAFCSRRIRAVPKVEFRPYPMDGEPKFAEATNLFVHDSGFESAMA